VVALFNLVVLVTACALVVLGSLAALAALLLPNGWRLRRTKRDS